EPTGAVDGAPFEIAPDASLGFSAASIEGTFLVGWADRDGQVHAAPLAARCPRPSQQIDLGSGAYPGVVGHCGGFLAAWKTQSGLSAARISGSGTLLDPAGFVVASGPYFGGRPALSDTGDGRVLVAYARFDRSPPYASSRVFGRMLTDATDTGA